MRWGVAILWQLDADTEEEAQERAQDIVNQVEVVHDCTLEQVWTGMVLPSDLREIGPQERDSRHSCEGVLTGLFGDLKSGHWTEGTTITCTCGKTYVHICDEAEGCAWHLT